MKIFITFFPSNVYISPFVLSSTITEFPTTISYLFDCLSEIRNPQINDVVTRSSANNVIMIVC